MNKRIVMGWMFLFLSLGFGSFRSSLADDPQRVRVGSKAFTENVILGEMLVDLIRHAGYEVDLKSEMGSRVAFDALCNGQLDVYPEYTGTILGEYFADRQIRSEADLRAELAKEGIVMSRFLGFNNTYALGMQRALAAELQLTRISDLARTDDPRIAALRFGVSDEFVQRRDGWPGLKEKYALPQSIQGMDHNLAYQGIAKGAIDVTDLYSTDAEIQAYDLVVLDDNLGYFPVYNCVWLYRDDLEQRAPQAVAAIRRLEGQLDNATMIKLNARVRLDRETESRAAAEYLNEKFDLGIPLPTDNRWQRMLRNLWTNTWNHLLLVSISLAAAILVAIPLGIAAGKLPRLGQPILGVVGVIQTIPSMAVLVLMIPLFGMGARPVIFALFLYSLLPIVRGVYAGLKEIPSNLHESALVLGLPASARLWRIELPLASRSILSGIKTAAVINVGTAAIGALIGAAGYGRPILTGLRLHDPSLLLQGAIPAALMAVAVQGVFEYSERFFVPAGLRKH